MRQPASARPAPVRQIFLLVSAVLMSGLVSLLTLPAQLVAADPASTSSEVNLRSGPGESYDVLSVIPLGAAITVDGDAVDGFFPATYNGVSGWVSASYVVAGATGTVSGYDTPAPQSDPSATYYDPGTVVVYETDAGGNQQRGNRRRNRDTANQPPTTTTSPDAAIPNPGAPASNEQEIISIIHQAANAYGQDPEAMVRVARCESNLNPRAIDASGSYHGLFQFVPSTFAATPYGGQDIYDPWANAHAAAWMWAEGRKSEWVCQ